MAKVPNQIKKFKTLEDDLSTTVATALWKKAADLSEYINKSRPVGMIMYFNNNQTLLPETPDPKYWKECDGSVVSNPDSPLDGVFIPNLRFKFHKHPADGQIEFIDIGADNVFIQHNHGGITSYDFFRGSFDADNDDDRAGPFAHQHTISVGGSVAASTVPACKEFKVYIRIL